MISHFGACEYLETEAPGPLTSTAESPSPRPGRTGSPVLYMSSPGGLVHPRVWELPISQEKGRFYMFLSLGPQQCNEAPSTGVAWSPCVSRDGGPVCSCPQSVRPSGRRHRLRSGCSHLLKVRLTPRVPSLMFGTELGPRSWGRGKVGSWMGIKLQKDKAS